MIENEIIVKKNITRSYIIYLCVYVYYLGLWLGLSVVGVFDMSLQAFLRTKNSLQNMLNKHQTTD